MTEEKKSREFWVDSLPCFDSGGNIIGWKKAYCNIQDAEDKGKGSKIYHVIEYSAYEALKTENERLKNYNELLSRGWPASDILKLQKQRDAALSVLAEAREVIEEASIALGKPAEFLKHVDHNFLPGSKASEMQQSCIDVIGACRPVYDKARKFLGGE